VSEPLGTVPIGSFQVIPFLLATRAVMHTTTRGHHDADKDTGDGSRDTGPGRFQGHWGRFQCLGLSQRENDRKLHNHT